MFRVFSVIIVSYPPITPASPTGFSRVADDKIFRSQLALDAIESLKRLAVARLAHNNLPAFEQVHIEHMRRLPHLPQNIIGSVDGIRNRPLIEQLQPMRNFLRRRV